MKKSTPFVLSLSLVGLAGCASVNSPAPTNRTATNPYFVSASAQEAAAVVQAERLEGSTVGNAQAASARPLASSAPTSSSALAAESSPAPTPKRASGFGSNLSDLIFLTPRHRNLLGRIQSGFDMPELNSPLVTRHEQWLQRNPEYLKRVFDRGGKYLHHIVEELEARKMPTELALLPIVESAFNPKALSSAKAAGLWQFIPATGRSFDLKQDWWSDERRDVIESTRAALDYLQKLYEMQGNDWFLALASYNWGEGAVRRAIRANEARGLPTDYLSLKMPRETSNYVPKLIALKNVLRDPEAFGLELPFIENRPYFVVIDKEQSIDLKLAASFAGMTVSEFTELNPSHHRPVINASRTNRIILPAEQADTFQSRLQEHIASGRPLVSWKPYTLKPQETLATLAKRAGVTSQELILANSLKRNANPLPGTTLLAPIAAQTDESHIERTLAKFSGTKVVEREQIAAVYHRVRKKETLASIARRYGVTVARLRSLNKIEQDVAVGMRLLIRPASNRTVMTDERGVKRVVKNPPAPAPVAAQKSTPSTKSEPTRLVQAPTVSTSIGTTNDNGRTVSGSPAKIKPN